jgi:hypothetical protein
MDPPPWWNGAAGLGQLSRHDGAADDMDHSDLFTPPLSFPLSGQIALDGCAGAAQA